jgi:hypothetical protein
MFFLLQFENCLFGESPTLATGAGELEEDHATESAGGIFNFCNELSPRTGRGNAVKQTTPFVSLLGIIFALRKVLILLEAIQPKVDAFGPGEGAL